MYFMVITGQGDAWDHKLSMREQRGWTDHAKFMNTLEEEGFVVLGGPLGDASRALLIVEAPDEAAVKARLEKDPWRHLRPVLKIEPWEVLLGKLTT